MTGEYLVKLPNGDVRVMTSDELDDAFERGLVKERTPVLAPGGTSWTTIARLGGFDTDEFDTPEEEHPPHPTSLSPISYEAPAPSEAPIAPAAAEPEPARRPSALTYLATAVGVLVLVCAVGAGAVKVGTVLASAPRTESAPPPPAETHAPPPPATAVAPSPAASSMPTIAVSALPSAPPENKKAKRR